MGPKFLCWQQIKRVQLLRGLFGKNHYFNLWSVSLKVDISVQVVVKISASDFDGYNVQRQNVQPFSAVFPNHEMKRRKITVVMVTKNQTMQRGVVLSTVKLLLPLLLSHQRLYRAKTARPTNRS